MIHRPVKKYLICIWCKVLIKVQQLLSKVPSRTYWNISKSFIVKFTLRQKIRKYFLFTKFITLNWNCLFFYYAGAIITFSSLIMFGISETRVVSFDAVLFIFRRSSTEAYSVSVSILLPLTSFLSEIFFLVTFLFRPWI